MDRYYRWCRFPKKADVIKMVNDSPYGLSASVFSKDVDRCYRVSNGIRTGLVWVNCWFAQRLAHTFWRHEILRRRALKADATAWNFSLKLRPFHTSTKFSHPNRNKKEEAFMDFGINGKRALVCAASRGLGFAIAKALAEEGADLIISARDEEKLKQAAEVLAQTVQGQSRIYCRRLECSRRSKEINRVCSVKDSAHSTFLCTMSAVPRRSRPNRPAPLTGRRLSTSCFCLSWNLIRLFCRQ